MDQIILKLEVDEYSIGPIGLLDIEKIRIWRNGQMDVLRQKNEISKEEQINYFNQVVYPEILKDFPRQIIYSLYHANVLIGYGGLVHISWKDKRAEISFLIDTERKADLKLYEKDFETFILMTFKLAFDKLGLNRISGETYSFRSHHISIMEKMGFICEGRMIEHNFDGESYYDSLIHGITKRRYERNSR